MSSTTAEAGVYRGSFEMPVGAGEVWDALVDPAQVCAWFAEKVEIEPRAGGAYRFWGKYTPTLGVAGPAEQAIAEFIEGAELVFTWAWGGVPGRCALRVMERGGAVTLDIEHTWEGDLHPFLVADFWEVAAANLESYLRTGAAVIRPDHSEFREEVLMSVEVDAPATRVWEVLTDPAEMRVFLGELMPCEPRAELRVGGVYTYGWVQDGARIGPQEIVELEAGRRLVHTWTCDDGVTQTTTEWLVEPLGGARSRLSVRQFGLQSLAEYSGYANGWASFLLSMKRVSERV